MASEEAPCPEDGRGVGADPSDGGRAHERARFRAELIEFHTLFPDADLAALPSEVTESELPLAAAYALYERRRERLSARAESENERNALRSAGGVSDGDGGIYTPDEVRRMTRDEIRKNYDAVLRSMRRWG